VAANDALSHSNADLQQFVILPATIYKNRYEWSPIYSQILKREFGEKLEPAGGKHIGSAVQAALRMERLLKDLLAYTLRVDIWSGADGRTRCGRNVGSDNWIHRVPHGSNRKNLTGRTRDFQAGVTSCYVLHLHRFRFVPSSRKPLNVK